MALNLAYPGIRRARRVVELGAPPPPAPWARVDNLELMEALKALPLSLRQVIVMHYLTVYRWSGWLAGSASPSGRPSRGCRVDPGPAAAGLRRRVEVTTGEPGQRDLVTVTVITAGAGCGE